MDPLHFRYPRTLPISGAVDNGPRASYLGAMAESFDIVIAGGGLNGTTLALALASGGFQVALVDPVAHDVRAGQGFDGRGYALALTSQRLLNGLGLWSSVAEQAQPMLEIRVSDGRAGEGASPFTLEFDQAELEEGPMGYMVEDRHLRPALLTACAEHPAITLLDGVAVAAETANIQGVTLNLSDGRTLKAHLLVAADGRKSAIAARAGIKRQERDYGQTALVCAVEHEEPHKGIAHQFFMPAGPLAILPLPGNRSSIVWAESTERAAQLRQSDDAAFLTALRPAFGEFLGAIALAGGRFSYPLSLSLAESFTAERLALVGDAAHGLHPIAGQGLNAGLKDVAALAEILTDARRRGEDIGRADILARYQRWRRFDVTTLALATDGFNRLFSNNNPALRLARDIGMAAVGRVPALRRGFMREAAGLTGDLPRLMRGLPL